MASQMMRALSHLLFLALAATSLQAGESSIRFDIPAGPALETLRKFGDRTKLNVIYETPAMRGLLTRAVNGTHEPMKAIRIMLAGTGFEALRTDSTTLSIVPRPPRWNPFRRRPGRSAQTDATPLDEVRITGSQIRGAAPIGSEYTVIESDDIEESASGSVSDVLHHQPKTHGAGPSEDTREGGPDAPNNVGLGTGLNCRGLGAGSTLVLVNGHRIAASGTDAAFFDLTMLPFASVEAIQLLPDAAAAAHGPDAIGCVVNFIHRRDFDGARTSASYGTGTDDSLGEWSIGQLLGHRWSEVSGLLSLDYHASDALSAADRDEADSDFTRFGGPRLDTERSNPGSVLTGTGWRGIPPGQDGTALGFDSLLPQANYRNVNALRDLIAAQRRLSLYGNLHFTPRHDLRLNLQGFLTRRRAAATQGAFSGVFQVPAENPFARSLATSEEPILVAYDFYRDLGPTEIRADVIAEHVAGELAFQTPGDWTLDAHIARSRQRHDQRVENLVNASELTLALADTEPSTSFNMLGDGSHTARETIERIRTTGETRASSGLTSAALKASGPLPSFFGREHSLGFGVDFRRETLDTTVESHGAGPDADYDKRRDVTALFAQLDIAAIPQKLALSLATRCEDFAGLPDVRTSRVGLQWTPMPRLRFLGNWSQSFRPPALGFLYDGRNGSTIHRFEDPSAPTGFTTALVEFGKNPGLRPETAESWAAGIHVEPPVPGLRLQFNYFNIRVRDRFETTVVTEQFFLDPSLAHLIQRDVTDVARTELCDRAPFQGRPGNDCLTIPVDALIDSRQRNLGVLETRGIDFSGRYSVQTLVGGFDLATTATYVIDYEQAQTSTQPLMELVDTPHQPIDFRLVGSLQYRHRAFGASLIVHHADGYHDTRSDPPRHVNSWTRLDAVLRYHFDQNHGPRLDGVTLSLKGENILDASAPRVLNRAGLLIDPENADFRGQRLSLVLTKNW